MASKLIIDRIPPDMHVDEKGNIVWTPRLIDYNAAAYSRGHVVTSDEFNTELLKQTYQGNYNTDTISVLIGLYNDLKTDVTDKATTALSKAITAEANVITAVNTANDAYSTSVEALSDVQAAVNASVEAVEAAETATVLSEEAMVIAEDASDRADEAKLEAYEAIRIAEAADAFAVSAEDKSTQALSISQLAGSTASSANTKADNAVTTANDAASTASNADKNASTAFNTANDANAAASTATQTANTANTTAGTALSNANSAVITANSAKDTANKANTTANTASANAANALSIAGNANTTANAAVNTANSAKQIATEAAATVAGKASTDYVDNSLKNHYTKTETDKLLSEVEVDLSAYYLGTKVDALDAATLSSAKSYTDTKVAALIDSAPETLDTFKEIADAFAEDQKVLDTLNAAIGLKADRTELFSGDYNDLSNKPIIPEVNQDTIAFAESERQKSKNLYENGNISGTRYVNTALKSPLPAGTYTISGILNSSDTDATICRVAFYKDNSVLLAYVNMERDARQGATFTISDTCTHLYVYASSNNTTASGDTFSFTDIMITSDVSTDYQPYYGAITHNGDAPIVFAESERQKSKNLFDFLNYSTLTTSTEQPVTFLNNGIKCSVNSVVTSRFMDYNLYLKAGTYTISLNCKFTTTTSDHYPTVDVELESGEETDIYIRCSSSYGVDKQYSFTFTVPSDQNVEVVLYMSNSFAKMKVGDIAEFTNIQIEESSVVTDYQPYYGEIVHKKDIVDLPTEYLKDATVSDDTLTLKKQDGTTLSFTGARQLVGEYTFGSASSFEITGLDLQGDGGVYDIIMEAPITSAQKNFCFRLNNNSATNAYVHSHFDIDPTNKSIIVGEQSDGTGWAYLGAYGPHNNITVMTLMLCQGRPMWVIDTTGYLGRLDFQKFFGYTVAGNVTSMQILASGTVSAGLKVKIYRRLT